MPLYALSLHGYHELMKNFPSKSRIDMDAQDEPYGNTTVKIWSASSGACLQTLKGHSDSVCQAMPSFEFGGYLGNIQLREPTMATVIVSTIMFNSIRENMIGIGTGNGRVRICRVKRNKLNKF
ncbi:uncharacterized protein EI97DRAFT_99829 [Westerdykella ornata]|uniref:WD40 repeat-like protein n=1 Tax=Westerdykella ornata TaxID=318751 RepID=A0A6A6JD12_WESOR|nr:uncharacterized protein EI97DRAFT_99829 [Westerdykella ornata]KAF2274451.1 hypothetical protein EI97DRAFT_99829 [Westerdykella ornata]